MVVWSLYGIACLCPAIKVDEGVRQGHGYDKLGTVTGIATLLLGWSTEYCLPWSANIFLLAVWILFVRKRGITALCFGVCAALLGFTTLVYSSDWEGLLVGYYLWQTSLIVFVVFVGISAMKTETPNPKGNFDAPSSDSVGQS